MTGVQVNARSSDPVPFLPIHRHASFSRNGELAILGRGRHKPLIALAALLLRPFCVREWLLPADHEANGAWKLTTILRE